MAVSSACAGLMLQEWEYAKVRQNAQLERIERGVGTLQEMAKGMQEELDKQNPVIDEIDTQLNKVTNQIKNNNAKLTGLVTQVQTNHQQPLSCHMTAATMKIIPQAHGRASAIPILAASAV